MAALTPTSDRTPGNPVAGAAPPQRPQFGYEAGQPFGDPNQFTRGTREDEIDRFNQWMRAQPWYQEYEQAQGLANRGPDRGFSDRQQADVERLLQQQGITLPGAFHVDPGGNINQKNRTGRNLAIAAAIGGGLVAAPAIAGALGAGGAAGGAGAAGAAGTAGAAGAGTLAATTPSLALGSLAGLAPTVAPALGAGAGIGAGVGAGTLASAAPAFTGAGFAPTVAPAVGGAGGGAVAGGSILSQLASNPETYSTIAGQLGRMGEGQAGERGAENAAALAQSRLLADLFATEQGASTRAAESAERGALDRATLGLQAPDIRTRQSILGSLIQELQPVTFGDTGRVKVPEIRGGLTPAALNPAARETGSILQKQAIDALLSGSDVPAATDFQGARLTPPSVPEYRQPGTGESILSGIGAAGNTVQGILASLRKQSEAPQVGTRGTGA